MARGPRIDVPELTYHGILRCNNEEWLLCEPDAKQVVLDILGEAVARHALRLHAYVIMDNHVHLVLSRSPACTLAVAMHWFMTQTAKELLRLTGRTGHVSLLAKAGGGFAFPHTENTVFGQPNEKCG